MTILAQAAIVDYAIAAEQGTSKTAQSPRRPCGFGSYCGIYGLYAVMKLSDIDVDPNELLNPEYIGSHKGSSLAELKKAAEDNGLYAVPPVTTSNTARKMRVRK